jgi:hypothetical protein
MSDGWFDHAQLPPAEVPANVTLVEKPMTFTGVEEKYDWPFSTLPEFQTGVGQGPLLQ